MIAYRVFTKDSKPTVKLLHMFIQGTAFVFGVLGLKAVFDFHNHSNIANMYSLHSWIGLTTFILFSCQVCYFSVIYTGFMHFDIFKLLKRLVRFVTFLWIKILKIICIKSVDYFEADLLSLSWNKQCKHIQVSA